MTSPTTSPPDADGGAAASPRVFTAVVLVEIVAIAALYWLGHHFG